MREKATQVPKTVSTCYLQLLRRVINTGRTSNDIIQFIKTNSQFLMSASKSNGTHLWSPRKSSRLWTPFLMARTPQHLEKETSSSVKTRLQSQGLG